ncbi:hypothetical protein COCC4DRAFT_58271 [Bipolaris maydis ATCC 48331]|uniref:Anaphase-promoting complex subunit CDC26 n=2 Tax=Cochliobolus heterostrophus TaxID=5016 RepID=M2V2X3_COCH5|nr:uncharacterized protein COCC4DRAFT_58271 [Bipolaris maydis ATCC 48331]EMD94327.1 hypothetical protein COCHEDRAFT_1153622 [Bipolaris maydis C5]KAH7563879.1 hypothetical protein BM1_00926 [Bipolaris maydis]ENI07375.1 hypothetical protein COCC4DRAFT_58271 [Bipolaris maydis ATCC 48331]KAJ5026508.1 hypothetical protein J3E73DRAFT_369546 [Bipolaris maydis]KAJ6209764.1 hypothetical protein PSV09DRAFT_1153622 [Bipolaris maydis]
MLRRAPTTITLTQNDIEQWEAVRQRKLYEAKQQQAEQEQQQASREEAKARSKKDRIMGA